MASDELHCDDEARGLQYEYRGPVGFELPPARPAAYGVGAALIVIVIFLVWLVSPSPWLTLIGVVASPVLAIWLTRKVMRHVDYYRPVRYWTSTGRNELAAPRTTRAAARTSQTTLSPSIFKEGPRR